jgi:hypothetical protein
MMARRDVGVGVVREFNNQRAVLQGEENAQGLASQLAAGLAQLSGSFHGVEDCVQLQTKPHVCPSRRAQSVYHRGSVGPRRGAAQVRVKKIGGAGGVAHDLALHISF